MKTKASKNEVKSSSMLKARLSSNKNSLKDFDEWCLQQFPELSISPTVLDLGCGNGKQLHLFSGKFPPNACFVGMDLSSESLGDLKSSYNSPPKLQLIEGSFDKEGSFETLPTQELDLAYAVYALYYTEDLDSLIKRV